MGSETYHAINKLHERKASQDSCSNFWLPSRAKTITASSDSIYIVFAVKFDKVHAFFSLGQMNHQLTKLYFSVHNEYFCVFILV